MQTACTTNNVGGVVLRELLLLGTGNVLVLMLVLVQPASSCLESRLEVAVLGLVWSVPWDGPSI